MGVMVRCTHTSEPRHFGSSKTLYFGDAASPKCPSDVSDGICDTGMSAVLTVDHLVALQE